MQEGIFAGIIVFFASILQAATGFGFAIVATPFLLLVYNSRDCIQISILVSLFIAALLVPKVIKHCNYDMLRRLAAGSLLGVPAGLIFFSSISMVILKTTVSAVILGMAIFSCLGLYKKRKSVDSSGDIGSDKPQRKLIEVLVGLGAGALTAGIGMPGVPLALYFSATNTAKEVVRSTTLTFFIFIYIASILAQLATVGIGSKAVQSSMLLLPCAAAGVVLGHRLFSRINQQRFMLLTNGILIYTALHMIFHN